MSRPNFLTKEDLRQFISCPVKPIHRWAGLRSKNDDDPFLRYIAQEGRAVGRTARRLFRNLVLIDEPFATAEKSTRELLEISSITLAESAFSHHCWRIRPDILAFDQELDQISIYEVKAKAISLQRHQEGKELMTVHGEIRAAWRDILFDLAMQLVVMERLFPGRKIKGYLILPEEECSVSSEESLFAASGKECPTVADSATIKIRRRESVLRIIDPGKPLDLAKDLVTEAMGNLEYVRAGTTIPSPNLRYQCRNCEYRLSNGRDPNDGFHQCWGKLAIPDPHLFDLHQLYQIGGQAAYANQRIQEGKTALLEVPEEDLQGSPYAARQSLQLRSSREGKEWLSEDIGRVLNNLEYPLRFLDFETSMNAIGQHTGLRPYELLPIQFSQHTIDEQGNLQHNEWLHSGGGNPILPFTRALLATVGDCGHVLIYTDYEIRVIRGVIDNLLRSDESPEEVERLEILLNSGRIVDQHDLLYRHYHHPLMGGKTSLKNVADAIWRESPEIRSDPWFRGWGTEKKSPYQFLPEIEIAGKPLKIADGCGAMEGFAELTRGSHSSVDQEKIRTAMLRYCELDTLSQVMIHQHWLSRFARKSGGESK